MHCFLPSNYASYFPLLTLHNTDNHPSQMGNDNHQHSPNGLGHFLIVLLIHDLSYLSLKYYETNELIYQFFPM